MPSNSSATKPTKQEEELVQLNAELQALEEETDELVAKVNGQRLSVPEVVQDLFTIVKENRLTKLERFEPEFKDTTYSVCNIDKAVDEIVNSTSDKQKIIRLQENLRKINRKIEDNQRHSELLYAGLSINPYVILPDARYLSI